MHQHPDAHPHHDQHRRGSAVSFASASETPAPAAQGSTGDILDADTAQALNGAARTAFELGEATVGFGIRL